MRHFPNKMLALAYERALGKTFTHSPAYKRFTDECGCHDYNYNAMVWLMDHGVLEALPMDLSKSLAFKYRISK